MLASTLVLKNECAETFCSLLSQYEDRIRPRDGVEHSLVEDLVASCWRLRRGMAIETALLNSSLGNQPPGDEMARLAAAFSALAASPDLALLSRYETRLHRMFQRGLANLYLLRSGVLSPPENFLPDEPNPENEHSARLPPASLSEDRARETQ
jgi:hypothetical protein